MGAESELSPQVKQFIGRYIRSLDQLEVLLLVSALPDKEWTSEDVYNVVRSNPTVVTERLDYFVKSGMMSAGGSPVRYRYQPKSPDLDMVIGELSAAYKGSRHRIVELIYSRPEPSDPLREFSDAFKLKKEGGE
jgi:hypothetical protein